MIMHSSQLVDDTDLYGGTFNSKSNDPFFINLWNNLNCSCWCLGNFFDNDVLFEADDEVDDAEEHADEQFDGGVEANIGEDSNDDGKMLLLLLLAFVNDVDGVNDVMSIVWWCKECKWLSLYWEREECFDLELCLWWRERDGSCNKLCEVGTFLLYEVVDWFVEYIFK